MCVKQIGTKLPRQKKPQANALLTSYDASNTSDSCLNRSLILPSRALPENLSKQAFSPMSAALTHGLQIAHVPQSPYPSLFRYFN